MPRAVYPRHRSCSQKRGETTIMNKYKSLTVLSLGLLLLGACATMDDGGIYGGGGGSRDNYEVRGTVDYVDPNSHSIYLINVSGYTSMLSGGSGGGNTLRVYYDNSTTVAHQGQSHRPEDLERGDQVTVRVDESGNALYAQSVTVTQDVSSGSTYPPNDRYGSALRGIVTYVDTSRRTIEI